MYPLMMSLSWLPMLFAAIGTPVGAKNIYLDRPAPNVSALIEHSGFDSELHRLLTSDGYQLTLRRLINPKIEATQAHRRPILMIPGVSATSGSMLTRATDTRPRDLSRLDLSKLSEAGAVALLKSEEASNSFAYLAAQLGYQVWLPELRGMPDSLGHISPGMEAYKNASMVLGEGVNTDHCASGDPSEGDYDPVEDILQMIDHYEQNAVNPDFWRFSLDEQAKYDFPAAVDHILKVSGADKLALLGHSVGANLILMAATVDETLARKVFSTILLAPIVYQFAGRRKPTPLSLLQHKLIDQSFAFHEKVTTNQFACLLKKVCLDPYEGGQSVCQRIKQPAGKIGDDPDESTDRIAHAKLPTSVRLRLHVSRLRGKSRFTLFDHGDPNINLAKYGQPEAPDYDLTKVELKRVTILSGKQDERIEREEIDRLVGELKYSAKYFYIDRPGVYFGHISPTMHSNVSTLSIIPMLRQIQLADAEDLSENSPSLLQWIGRTILGWLNWMIGLF